MAVDLWHQQQPSSDEAAAESERLFALHSERILAFCRHMLRDRDDAEDAVQTTFLQAHRALQRGVSPRHESAWLHTIAKNACRAQLRAGARRRRAVADVDLDAIPGRALDEGEEELVQRVGGALAALPDRQRRVLLMREWRGLSVEEAAAHLGISVSATHALLHRARRSFATAISASRRPLAGLNVAALAEPLRGVLKLVLGGAAVKAAVVTTAAGVAVGGVLIEQRRSESDMPPPPRPVGTTATIGATSSPAASLVVPPRVVVRKGEVAPPAVARSSRQARDSATPGPAQTDTTVTRLARRPRSAATPPASPPPGAEAPSPTPDPPVDLPVLAPPVDLPPILGEAPPVQLPAPVEDLVPPVSVPPLWIPPLEDGLSLLP
jgi:RNA polymerase sigma-70 factor (ECF subfamily)